MKTRRILGQCHCGNIRFEFLWPESAAEIPVRACSCTFCIKHGGVYTSHPKGRLDVEVSNGSLVRAYQFGTGTADFHVCLSCGVVAFVTSRIEGMTHAVVNVNTFENVNRSDLIRAVTDFEGETKEERLARRKRTWVPNVSVRAARA